MRRKMLGVFGGGGLAREVAPIIRSQIEDAGSELLFVVPDSDEVACPGSILEHDFLNSKIERQFCIPIADTRLRKELFSRALESGAMPLSVIAPSAIIYDTATVGDGAIIMPNAVISTDTQIGCASIINFNTYVAHDCVVGEFVTIGPAAVVAGNVSIGDGVTIGAGVRIRNGTEERKVRVDSGAVLGMGSVVLSDVARGQTVVGCPAKQIS